MFIAIAQAGNFTRAAEELLLSQSSLTVTLRQLERELGVSLFSRTTRQVSLTADGDRFLIDARRIVDDFDKSVTAMHLAASQAAGTVQIAVLPSIAIRMLPGILTPFRNAHKDISIVQRDDNARGLHRQVRENEVDFGICNKWYDHPELEYVPLTQDRFGLVCRKDDPLAQAKLNLSWKDIDASRLFILAPDTGVYTTLNETPELENLLAKTAGKVLVMVTLLEMVRAGIGVTVLPELAKPGPNETELAFVPLSGPVVSRKLCLIRRRDEPLSTSARRVWDAIRSGVPAQIDLK